MTVTMNKLQWLQPDWPAPTNIRALTTLRMGGVSLPPYASLNLGDHVDDDPKAVSENRQRLQQLKLPSDPLWLKQTHSTRVVDASTYQGQTDSLEADASYSTSPGLVCAVMTADCLPVLICNRQGTQVAAVHAGWRGLAAGIIEAAIKQFPGNHADLLIWLGPAIGPAAYEVGNDVRVAFLQQSPEAEQAFKPSNENKWYMDIYSLARQRLAGMGVRHIYGGEYCTYTDQDRFYSYRRDGITGRMASLIWM